MKPEKLYKKLYLQKRSYTLKDNKQPNSKQIKKPLGLQRAESLTSFKQNIIEIEIERP